MGLLWKPCLENEEKTKEWLPGKEWTDHTFAGHLV